MNLSEILFFGSFTLLICFFLFLDLGVFDKKSHNIPFRESIIWTSVWVSLAMIFFVFIRYYGIDTTEDLQHITSKYYERISITGMPFQEALSVYQKNMSLEFITGYVIEYSLSIDNIFVIILVFASFGIPQKHFKRILFWGIIGAFIMRFIFIFLSSALISRYGWILYIFGAFLLFTGVKMFLERNKEEEVHPEKNPIVKWLSKRFPVTKELHGQKFLVRLDKKVHLTPLFICLVVIEFTDLLFAVDSVPAIFSVTKDPYIVFFSNIFAILGLRSLFFLVNNIMNLFRYLKIGLAVLLSFIGVKMLAHHWLEQWGFDTIHSLIVIFAILAVSIIASLIIPEKKKA
jgi:tellurite resistance protein TerC